MSLVLGACPTSWSTPGELREVALVAPPAPAAATGEPEDEPAPARPFSILAWPFDPRTRKQRQWDHIVQAAPSECREALGKAGAKFETLPERTKPDARGCGVPHGVLVTRGPTGIGYSPPLQIDCSLALHLVQIEAVIQAKAEEHLGSPIRTIGTLGSFACRPVIGRLSGWSDGMSEHSFGNAVDLATFVTKRGRTVRVSAAYRPDLEQAPTPASRFLRTVARSLRTEARVRVLGPEFDASHRDHLHLDRGTSRWQ